MSTTVMIAFLATSFLAAAQDSVADAVGTQKGIDAATESEHVCDPSKTGFKEESSQVYSLAALLAQVGLGSTRAL